MFDMNSERVLAKGLMPAPSPHCTPCTNILFIHWIMPNIILPEFYLAPLLHPPSLQLYLSMDRLEIRSGDYEGGDVGDRSS